MPPKPQRTKRLPIYRNAGFLFDTIGEAADVFAREEEYPQSADRFSYSRYGNPNVAETEEQLAEIEGAQWAVLTASGMAAIDTALSAFQLGDQTGPWLFFSELYGGTNDYIENVLIGRRGIDAVRFHPEECEEQYDLDRLEDLLDNVEPSLLYFEPVTNPLLIVSDGGGIIELAKERGIPVIVDNTFATSRLWRPLEHGADIVVHSATKYLGGHGNLTAGVVCGNDSAIRKDAMLYRKYVGNTLSPDDAYRLNTQSRTFALRFAAQCQNASKLATALSGHPAVERVRYPGLESHPTHDEAAKMFEGRGYGAMINVDFKGGRAAADAFVEAVSDTISYVPTLGDPTTIMLHVATVWGEKRFPYPGMVRISVGFEPYDHLESGVLRALDEVAERA
ncbi:MAG: aminotransferase class I/II-fold pyridoxal phosphate-dependent enzyme [Chloroflexi bacterium]|nr:aminotransferase class I/II-fold pyridoxal phosphate-dependent enzyme [Chloroflexota bacterium]